MTRVLAAATRHRCRRSRCARGSRRCKHLQAGFALTIDAARASATPVYDPNRDALIADRRGYQRRTCRRCSSSGRTDDRRRDRRHLPRRLRRSGSCSTTRSTTRRTASTSTTSCSTRRTSSATATSPRGELPTSPCTGAARRALRDAGLPLARRPVRRRRGREAARARRRLAAGVRVGVGVAALDLPVRARRSRRDVRRSARRRQIRSARAPTVFVRPDGDLLLTPTSRFTFETLPNVFRGAARRRQRQLLRRSPQLGRPHRVRRDARRTSSTASISTPRSGRASRRAARSARPARTSRSGATGSTCSARPRSASTRLARRPAARSEGGGGPAALLRVTATQEAAGARGRAPLLQRRLREPVRAPDLAARRVRRPARARRGRRAPALLQHRQAAHACARCSTSGTRCRRFGDEQHPRPHAAQARHATSARTSGPRDELRLGLWVRYQDKDLLAGGHDAVLRGLDRGRRARRADPVRRPPAHHDRPRALRRPTAG